MVRNAEQMAIIAALARRPMDSNGFRVARIFRSWSGRAFIGYLMAALEIDTIGG